MATNDHGLEVLRKASEIYNNTPSESIIRVKIPDGITVGSNPFAPPTNSDYISRSVSSNVETYLFKSGGAGGTLLKTIVITYADPTLTDMVTVEVS